MHICITIEDIKEIVHSVFFIYCALVHRVRRKVIAAVYYLFKEINVSSL